MINACSTFYIEQPIPIKHGSLGRSHQLDREIIDYFLKLKENKEGVFSNNGEGWKTDWYSHLDHPILEDLINQIGRWYEKNISAPRHNHSIPDFFKKDTPLVIDANIWFAEYLPGNLSNQHHHGNFPKISFVYYLEVEENGSPLTFIRQTLDEYNDIEFINEIDLAVHSGMLVMFPPNIHHKVRPTKTKRYIIAGNINDISYKLS